MTAMKKVRIQASENVRYSKIMEVDEDTLAMLKTSWQTNKRPDAADFLLEPEDIVDGDMDGDDLTIDIFEDGKWKPYLLTV